MKESEFVHLGREDVPEWFTLDLIQGVDPTVLPLPLPLPAVPLLVLGIAEETLHHLIDVLPRCGWIDGCEERLNEYEIATKFLFDASKPWGFRGCSIRTSDQIMLELSSTPFPFLKLRRMPANAGIAGVQVKPTMVGIASTATRRAERPLTIGMPLIASPRRFSFSEASWKCLTRNGSPALTRGGSSS